MKNALTMMDDASLIAWFKAHPTAVINQDYVVVDIREPDEYASGHVEGSMNCPSSQLSEPPVLPSNIKTAFFHCRSGHRTQVFSGLLAKTVVDEGYCLTGGWDQWKRCVQGDKTAVTGTTCPTTIAIPLSIFRQAQIISGSVVLLGIALSFLLSTSYILISVLAAAGLVASGITGVCHLAKALQRFPFNRS